MIDIVKKIKESAVRQIQRVVAEQPKEPTLEEKIKILETKVEELEKGN